MDSLDQSKKADQELVMNPFVYRLLRPLFRIFIKPFIPRLKKYHERYKALKVRNIYNVWAQRQKDKCFVRRSISSEPLISVVVPTFNTPHNYLLEMIYSVVNQHYENWELILVNASSSSRSRQQIKECADIDSRIKVVEIAKNEGISANTNAGIKQASGEFIALLDHDDLLHPCALHSVAEWLQKYPETDIFYTDEDKISADSERFFNPHIKPNWSPDLLRNVNYMTHLMVIRRELVNKVGGLRPATDGAQDYDLLLRASDTIESEVIKHIPRILYHWRAAGGSTAEDIASKNYVLKAGTKALNDHLRRKNIKASVTPIEGKPGFYEVVYKPVKFSVIIGPVAQELQAATSAWLDKLIKNYLGEHGMELIVGDWYESFMDEKSSLSVKLIPQDDKYWSKAANAATAEVAVCFKAAALPKSRGGLQNLVAVAADPNHMAVAPILTNESLIIISSGIIQNQPLPKKLFEGYKLGVNTWFGNTDWVRNVDDLTMEVLALRASVLESLVSNSKRFASAPTVGSLKAIGSIKSPNLVVWAHTPFRYLGAFNPKLETDYQQFPSLRFMPTINIHVDDWEREYLRERE